MHVVGVHVYIGVAVVVDGDVSDDVVIAVVADVVVYADVAVMLVLQLVMILL